MKSPEMGGGSPEKKHVPDTNRALLAAYKALLFNDSSDYGSGLWEVLEALDPEIAKKLEAHLGDTNKESKKGVEILNELEKRIS